LYGLYSRDSVYTGGTFSSVWFNTTSNQLVYGTAPDGNDYAAFSINSGIDYTSLCVFGTAIGFNPLWGLSQSTGNTIFNGATIDNQILLGSGSTTPDGTYYYPKAGAQQFNGGYVQYPAICPTPTPTASVTPTNTQTQTPTNTLTPTPTRTPVVNLVWSAATSIWSGTTQTWNNI
jgi:hypothetical protein